MSGPRAAGANDPNIPRRKEISSRDVFVWMGHGNEVPIEFNERRTVPDGKIIVLLAEYGKPVKAYRGEDIWKGMATNPEVFRRPESKETQALLSGTVHIYYPGDRIPKFLYYPFLVQKEPEKWAAYPSGVYKLDMEKESGFALPSNGSGAMKKENVSRGPIPWDTIFSGDENKVFLENVKAKNSAIVTPSMYHKKEALEKVFVKDSDELLDELPDGIHYFMSCRLIKGQAAQVASFFNKLKEHAEFLIEYLNFFELGIDHWDMGITKEQYNIKSQLLKNKLYEEVYTGPLRPILLRSILAKDEDISEEALANESYIFFTMEHFLKEVFNIIKRCIEATQMQSRMRGPFTADEYIETFRGELEGFIARSRHNAEYQLFFQLIHDIIKDGLKDILEPVERRRRNSLVQQQKAGRRTRKLKKKSKSKTR